MTNSPYGLYPQEYQKYADGENPTFNLNEGTSCRKFGYADKLTGQIIEQQIEGLVDKLPKGKSFRILDAGCGPGTWTLRVLHKLRKLNVAAEVVAFDLERSMVERTQELYERYCNEMGFSPDISFKVFEHNILDSIPVNECDLCLCLYTVMNHMPSEADLAKGLHNLLRCGGHLIVSMKGPYSLPTAYVAPLQDTMAYSRDPANGHLQVVTRKGIFYSVPSNLFHFNVVKNILEKHNAQVIETAGIDLLISRFTPDPNFSEHADDWKVPRALERLEDELRTQNVFLDYANHYLFIAESNGGLS